MELKESIVHLVPHHSELYLHVISTIDRVEVMLHPKQTEHMDEELEGRQADYGAKEIRRHPDHSCCKAGTQTQTGDEK